MKCFDSCYSVTIIIVSSTTFTIWFLKNAMGNIWKLRNLPFKEAIIWISFVFFFFFFLFFFSNYKFLFPIHSSCRWGCVSRVYNPRMGLKGPALVRFLVIKKIKNYKFLFVENVVIYCLGLGKVLE
jgi:hypothetical protein